jgi:hypothetical protein
MGLIAAVIRSQTVRDLHQQGYLFNRIVGGAGSSRSTIYSVYQINTRTAMAAKVYKCEGRQFYQNYVKVAILTIRSNEQSVEFSILKSQVKSSLFRNKKLYTPCVLGRHLCAPGCPSCATLTYCYIMCTYKIEGYNTTSFLYIRKL